MANEQYETFDFTEVERPASGGVVISGDLWGRDQDQIGIGGALSYDGERLLETYSKRTIADGLHVSLDYQFVDNPEFSADGKSIDSWSVLSQK